MVNNKPQNVKPAKNKRSCKCRVLIANHHYHRPFPDYDGRPKNYVKFHGKHYFNDMQSRIGNANDILYVTATDRPVMRDVEVKVMDVNGKIEYWKLEEIDLKNSSRCADILKKFEDECTSCSTTISEWNTYLVTASNSLAAARKIANFVDSLTDEEYLTYIAFKKENSEV